MLDLLDLARAGALRPVEPGDIAIVRDLPPLRVVAVAENLQSIEAETPEGFGFIVFTDAIDTVQRTDQ